MTEDEEFEVASYIDKLCGRAEYRINELRIALSFFTGLFLLMVLVFCGLLWQRHDTRQGVIESQEMLKSALILDVQAQRERLEKSSLSKEDVNYKIIENYLKNATFHASNESDSGLPTEYPLADQWRFEMQKLFGMDLVATQGHLAQAQEEVRNAEHRLDALGSTPDQTEQGDTL